MGDPPLGQNVVVTLTGGGTSLAYWDGEQWMIGVENDPLDAPLDAEVTSWQLVTSEA
jgi:hypothetical protein